jgi:hypothetical protein
MRHDWTGTPFVSQGSGERSPATIRAWSRTRSVRSIAAGRILPTPGRYGLFKALIASSVTTTTVVAEPMSIACDPLGSPLSAKNSMNAKTVPAVRKSTTKSENGMTPDAP